METRFKFSAEWLKNNAQSKMIESTDKTKTLVIDVTLLPTLQIETSQFADQQILLDLFGLNLLIEKIEFSCLVTDEHPVIKFILKNTPENTEYIQHPYFTYTKFYAWGKTQSSADWIEIIVTGKIGILLTINDFIKHHCTKKTHHFLINYLKQLTEFLEQRSLNKIRSLPLKSKDSFLFTDIPSTKAAITGSHTCFQVHKTKNPASLWYMKITNAGDVEAFLTDLYQWIWSDYCVPTARSIYENGKINAVASKAIKNFRSAYQFFDPKNIAKLALSTPDFLIELGAAEMLATSFALEEHDLNQNNWGFDVITDETGQQHFKLTRIDFDRSLWKLSCKYIKIGPYQKNYSSNVKRIDALPITEKNLIDLVTLEDAMLKEFDWPREIMHGLQFHPDFNRRKWKCFLRIILLPEKLLTHFTEQHFGTERKQIKFKNHVNDRFQLLEKTLLQIRPFQAFLLTYPSVPDEIIQEFYQDHQQKKHALFAAHLAMIKNKYQCLLEQVKNILIETQVTAQQELSAALIAPFEIDYQSQKLKLLTLLTKSRRTKTHERIEKLLGIIDKLNARQNPEEIINFTDLLKNLRHLIHPSAKVNIKYINELLIRAKHLKNFGVCQIVLKWPYAHYSQQVALQIKELFADHGEILSPLILPAKHLLQSIDEGMKHGVKQALLINLITLLKEVSLLIRHLKTFLIAQDNSKGIAEEKIIHLNNQLKNQTNLSLSVSTKIAAFIDAIDQTMMAKEINACYCAIKFK
ncbi:MAG: hypothetical protein JO149_09230 [Gammaproteobacteria bacterium]|nr:hypothetical protein [Gammaproteobacteria bacterium]